MKLKRLAKLRMQAGLTQTEFAVKLGLSIKNYNHKENGIRKFTPAEMNKVYKVLKRTNPKLNMQDIFFN
ncbi:hypothetical protein HMPREF0872_00450 [Veillonella montpellierensis DNF00314]|uniref:HTH cro/C1-type domain-containing protein n=1 Tax=Veillonella montpellierensis DNF00314 TaxID=1401067 RepID=A0A096BZC6_9FIRM|nr:helix-turn-helix transcriptional regulator [Veillonella montpellierensis]KGF48107.1 hypothetical protein HMPREF0872_00450 [Veillonella montpellierensis DNF00314]